MASQTHNHDDAPPLTSKHSDVVTDAAESLDLTVGDSVSTRSVTINKPQAELFAFFRDFSNLPKFMENIERVDVIDATRSHWVVKAPVGEIVEWDSTITEESPPSSFAWTSKGNIPNSGRVDFRDAGPRGTIVTAMIAYDPPGGTIGKLIAKLFQREPALQARRDLRRLKQLMETGEVSTNARTAAALAKEKE
ncbi:SRPBCC family protein [Polymorphobacter sp. PAMC 29334]|uniref:SRPBCC family protein n=1 Tax=Polymorphobacter sp. PAMC 29334 TaxID=2862331 RepID=UPI001C682F0D|nr:SRPBCC family protein [Polymorphobacter sp. PAMC 29334]QYE33916.1 SRPBCC family protein [Polymorphobacter sp. PAMC 29334]